MTDLQLAGAFVLVALGLAPLAALAPTLGVGLSGGLLLVLGAALWPRQAVILYIAVTPLLVGTARGALVPYLRLSEALLVPVLAGLALALLRRWQQTSWRWPGGFHRLDLAVLATAFTSSASPLLWMYARGRTIAVDDLLYALDLWKLAAVYAVVRLFLRDVRTMRTMLSAVLWVALLVGGVGVLQALGVGPVIDLLGTWVLAEEGSYELDINRAMSTLGNPIAYGDLMLYAGVAAASLALRQPGRSSHLWMTVGALAVCALASGQFSIVLGLVTIGIVFAVVTGTGRYLAPVGLALLAVAAIALQPVLTARTDTLDPDTGLPVSWTGRYGRIGNLQHYFLPELGADFNWLFGVRTSSRLPGVEWWREWVYIESGYVWALWNGGLPLLVAVIALITVAVRTGRRLSSSGDALTAAMGTTLIAVPWTLAVLMFLDPHLGLRGGGDLLFVLLALGATLDAARKQQAPDAPAVEPSGGGRQRVSTG